MQKLKLGAGFSEPSSGLLGADGGRPLLDGAGRARRPRREAEPERRAARGQGHRNLYWDLTTISPTTA